MLNLQRIFNKAILPDHEVQQSSEAHIYAIALVLIEAIILLHDIMPLEKCIKFEYMYLPYSFYNVTVPHQGSDSGLK